MDLSGITILDLTRLLPGPYATQVLADLGADVIKVEDPDGGDYARSLPPLTDSGTGAIFEVVNRGKRSVAIDLKAPDGQEVFSQLLEGADVLFEGFRPGVARKLGVDYETVTEYNPDIVYCSLSGFGQTGPLADTVGHDLTYQGYAGLLDLTREGPEDTPQPAGFPVADMAGSLFALFSIVGGLLSRELGNGGEYIDISMTEALAAFGQPYVPQTTNGNPPQPGETDFTGGLPWYDVYETADGAYVTLAALEPKFFREFVKAIDREDLESLHGTTDPTEREVLSEELTAIFRERSRDEWIEFLGAAETTVGPVLSFQEAMSHPHLQARGLLESPVDGGGPRIGFPGLLSNGRPRVENPAPALGANTHEVLAEAGVSSSRLETLQAEGVILEAE